MLARFRGWKGIVDDRVAAELRLPFNRDLRTPSGDVKEPRYYQRVAIERDAGVSPVRSSKPSDLIYDIRG